MEQKGESSAETVGQSLPGCCNTGHTKVGRITLRGQRELIPLRLTIGWAGAQARRKPHVFPAPWTIQLGHMSSSAERGRAYQYEKLSWVIVVGRWREYTGVEVYPSVSLIRRVTQILLETNRHKGANKNCYPRDIGCDPVHAVYRRQYHPGEAAYRSASEPSSDART